MARCRGRAERRIQRLPAAGFLYRNGVQASFFMMNPPGDDPASDPANPAVEVQRLFLKHSGAIKGFVLALLRNPAVAEDVVQETFLVVVAKADTFRPGSNFVAWACTIARFKALEAMRRQTAPAQVLSEEVVDALAAERPEENQREDTLKHLEHCLRELPSASRTVIVLRYFHALLPEQIAARLEVKTDSVYVALTRARKSLRRCVEGRLAQPEGRT